MPKVKAINDLFLNIFYYIPLIDPTTDCFCTLTLNLLIFSLQQRACSDNFIYCLFVAISLTWIIAISLSDVSLLS